MLKTVLAVVGILAVLGIIMVVGSGYYAYTKLGDAMIRTTEQNVNRYIAEKHPSESVANSMHRIINGVKLHRFSTDTTSVLMAVVMNPIQTGTMTDEQVKMLDGAAQLAEQTDITKEQLTAFVKKYQSAMPPGNSPQPQPAMMQRQVVGK